MTPGSFQHKIKNAMRIDRAFAIVWQASRRWTILGICITAVQGSIPILYLYLLKLIIDTVTTAVQTGAVEGNFSRILYLVLAAAFVAILQAACQRAGDYVAEAQVAEVTDYITDMVHKQSISLDLAFYEDPQYYDTLYRAQREGIYRPPRIVNGLTRALQSSVALTAMVGLLFLFHWSIGLLLLISVLPGIFTQIFHAKKRFVWQKKRTADERRSLYYNNILTLDSFAKEIRLFDLGTHFSNLFSGIRKQLRGEKLTLAKSRSVADFCAQTFAAIVLMSSLLFIAHRALLGAITVGDMVMFFQAFQRGVNSLKDLLTQLAALYEDNMFVSNFFDFLDIESKINDPKTPHPVPAPFKQGIALQNLSFTYPGTRSPVLHNISFSINPGEVVAIVGANGAGKSTLVKLLCRLYDPQHGTIQLDGTHLSQFTQKDLRKQISVVFQDFAKYYLTVRENIWLGDISLSLKSPEIEIAGGKSDAAAFIKKLPQGYDTQLGRWFQNGEELSIGEWQKIVLARAFLRNAQLIILDEPTSSMDVHTEYHLYTKFRELIAGRSAVIISHRFSTVKMADTIYVMESGRISESGNHQKLMKQKGLYAEMYEKQAAWLQTMPEDRQTKRH